ncbi:dTDP-4-dehydrorhamnose reductase [Streptoalloteichus tenebrarius]|uniref:dTDP-4-dehydrorhamnose reductase n=1 Tax=Streptoalloteichus tenebrarius (strain ATCC 17920 / DSM 40477 / JCM 4838 / CBS 697.72 / NBRC 16177 / NCIMB 11028 / NRRL B-12390 / A12253. 1 / ISP 5477) TaxID=1933 RepID=A0ABT1HSZ6_STRSD|nr:dTDP-4-dehydrorhamnose reductase [Streptoalloteichus tenebrarius]MCP2258648.1 dTDP-4-dehydrorhamnose reductase [Streptoalloteichus tenebrarius]BFF02793.1 dTDP-4-dehydrorhamnose reductase [Streptoalloteichus tenebrarius]
MTGLALLVAGGRGQLGRDLAIQADTAAEVGFTHAPGSAELDVTDREAVDDAVAALASSARDAGLRPVLVNASAYTAVDAAESDVERAFQVNADGPRLLAAACAAQGVPLVHVSTDYVFPGDADRPYEPDDPTGPKSVYGRSKLAGEREVLRGWDRSWVVRTAWVYGAHGGNFVKTMCRLERERETLTVVDDQRGSPTWSADLAAGLLELARRVAVGPGPEQRVLHCTNAGETTWCGFARAVFEELGADPSRVRPCATADFPRPAPRPAYSVLSGAAWRAAGLTPPRPWREALAAAFASGAFAETSA